MLGTVLTHLRQKVGLVISNVMALMTKLHSKLLGVLTAIKTRFADSLTNLQLQLVVIQQKSKALHASLTILVSSIKAVLTIAKVTVTQIGLLLQTTVRQIHQLVSQALKNALSLVKKDTKDK